jgi:hypothetical protein
MKVGDKVFTFGVESLIVYIDNHPETRFPYLVVTKNTSGFAYSNWLAKEGLKPVPKFKVGEVWRTREHNKMTIISVYEKTVIAIRDPNTDEAEIWYFEADGKYHAGLENDFDLVEKVQ